MYTFKQTPMPVSRNFKSWLYELSQKKIAVRAQFELEIDSAKMYYNGGYSPKMVVHEVLHIPPEIDLFTHVGNVVGK